MSAPRETLVVNGPPDSPLRICYLSSVFLTDRAGTERHLVRLARALDPARFHVQLLTLHASRFSDQWPYSELPFHSFGFRSLYRPDSWWKIRRLALHLRTHGCQILELHSPEAQFVGSLAGRWAGCRLVSCRRSLGYQFQRTHRWQLASTNPSIDRFLANAQAVADARCKTENIAPERFTVIHNGVDLDAPEVTDPGSPRLSGDHPWLVVVANLRVVKNHRLLFQAIRRLEQNQVQAHCAVVGEGPEESNLRQLAHELRIEQRVRFLGSLSNVTPLLQQAAVGCLPSDSEGFPNALLEYMAARLPVVATDVGGAAEAVVDGTTGFLVPRGDVASLAARLQQLLTDAALRQSMGAAGRRRVETHFTVRQQLAAYERFYEQLCAGSS